MATTTSPQTRPSLVLAWLGHVWPALLIALGLSLAAWAAGYLADYYRGEDFLLYNLAETHSFAEAVRLFFLEHGRFFEAVWWLGEYKATGYQPGLHHFISLLLNIVAAAAGSLALYRSAVAFQNRWFASGFLLAVFLHPFTTNWALILSGDNSRISITLFFVAVLCFQNWLRGTFNMLWAALGWLCFALAALTYESVVFMFPAVVLILLFMDAPRLLAHRGALITLAIVFALTLLVPLGAVFVYQHFGIESHPALRGDGVLGGLLGRVFAAMLYTFELLASAGKTLHLLAQSFPLWPLALAAVLLLAAMAAVWFNRQAGGRKYFWLVAAAVWWLYVSVFTYAMAYLNGTLYVRFYAIMVYGLALLAAIIVVAAPWRWLRVATIGIVLAVSVLGVLEFTSLAAERNQTEQLPEFDYLSLLDVAPRVQSDTSFVLVDAYLGTSPHRSCTLALRMLYRDDSIGCVYISDQGVTIYAERGPGTLNSHEGGWIRNEKFIIVGMNADGERYIIPELTPASSVDIEWLDNTPIQTDYTAFQQGVDPIPTRMYLKLLERETKGDT